MIILTRCCAIYSSPRIERFINYCERTNRTYHVIGWDRKNEGLTRLNTTYYTKAIGTNVGGFKAVLGRIGWMWFLFRQFMHYKGEVKVIHAYDLDTAFPAVIFKLLFKRKTIVIFDIADWFSATLYNSSNLVKAFFSLMESVSVKYADYIFIPEEERKEQIPYKIKCPLYIVPNIPTIGDSSFLCSDSNCRFNNDKFTISYVGGFAEGRFLMELLTLAEEGLFNLNIAGFGSKDIEAKCAELSIKDNVRYYGRVNYKEGLNIQHNSDIIFAVYNTSNPNHIYAAPNKYYEAMFLHKPILTNEGTILTRKVKTNQLGFIIDESVDSLRECISTFNRDKILQYGDNAGKLWEQKYNNYVSDFQEVTYSSLIDK